MKHKPRYTRLGRELLSCYRMARHLGQPPAQARQTAEHLVCLLSGGRSNYYVKHRMMIYWTRRGGR